MGSAAPAPTLRANFPGDTLSTSPSIGPTRAVPVALGGLAVVKTHRATAASRPSRPLTAVVLCAKPASSLCRRPKGSEFQRLGIGNDQPRPRSALCDVLRLMPCLVERALTLPVHATGKDFGNKAPYRLQQVPESVRQVIEEVQPFRWEHPDRPEEYHATPLWQLNELDVIDKHCGPTVTAASLDFHGLGVPHGVDAETVFHIAAVPHTTGSCFVLPGRRRAPSTWHMAGRGVVLVEPAIVHVQPVRDMLLCPSARGCQRGGADRVRAARLIATPKS